MHGRKSGIAWKYSTCCCLISVLVAASSAFAVEKTVKVVMSGANVSSATVAYGTAAGLIKLQPAADGNRYLSTSGDKVTLNVDVPGLGASNVDVVLPNGPAVTVQVDLNGKVSARVIENGKRVLQVVPGATPRSIGEVASAPASGVVANSSNGRLTTHSIQSQVKGFSNPTAGPRGAPANDNCAAAIAVTDGSFGFDTTGATTDGPALPGSCEEGFGLAFGADIWYSYTATCDGNVTVSLCGSSYDTRMAIYSGTGCPASTLTVCNDDFCALQSQASFAATTGSTFLIRIGGFGTPGAAGAGTCTISCGGGGGGDPACASGVGCQNPDQQGHGADGTLAATSDRATGFIAADNFTPTASGNITSICWWGVYLNFGLFVDCAPGPGDNFLVTYHNDDAGGSVPGSVLAGPIAVSPTVTPTGNILAGIVEEQKFEVTHAPVAVSAGTCYWIEISNQLDGSCVWLWDTAPPGDGRSAQIDGAWGPTDWDLAFCLDVAIASDGCGTAPPPDNDECADARLIACGSSDTVDNTAATTDAGDPLYSCAFFGPQQGFGTLWWQFQATDTSAIVSLCNSGATDTLLAVYSGTCGNLTEIACNDDFGCGPIGLGSQLCVEGLVIGNVYYIQASSFSAADQGSITLDLTCPCPPTPCNEPAQNCHAGNTADAFNSTAGLFNSADDFTPASDGAVSALCWWGTFQGSCSADDFTVTYYADSGSNLPGAVLGSFSQSGGTLVVASAPTGQLIAGVAPEIEYAGTHAAVNVTAGTCYWVEVSNNVSGCSWFWELGTGGNARCVQDGTPPNGYDAGDAINGTDLAFCLNLALGDDSVCAPPPPDNDECDGAVLVACNSTVTADNSSATTAGSDPLFSCAFFGPQQGFGTLWYSFVATDDSAQVNLCDSGATDTLLAVYSGTCGSLTEIACNDDFSCGPIGLGSQLCATGLTVGNTYYIQVASFSAADTGAIELDLTCPCPEAPPGDLCEDAVGPLAVPSTTLGSTVGTSIDTAPFCGTSISAAGVWYTVVGTGNTITASACNGTPYDAKLNVYCGPCNALTCVTGIDDFCGLQPQVSWCSQAGALYRILVQGFGGATGSFTLELSDDGVSCAASVLCASVGGCCVGGDCIIRTADDCAALGGDYLGDDTDCAPTGATTTSYVASGLNLPIPDNNTGGVSHTINVPDSATIEDVDIDLSVTHTWVGDLIVTVAHNATVVTIVDRPGVPALGTFGCDTDNYNNIILDDEALLPIEDQCLANLTSPPNYRPNGLLSAFDGMDAGGPWIITITDNAGQDLGTLTGWSLHFSSGGTSPCVQEECDTCPPGTIAITDAGGDFSGWCASVSHPANVVITTLDVNQGTDTTNISIAKNFKEGPGFGGLIPAILIDFVQVCPDSQTTNIINIAGESIQNNTGVDWRDFHWLLFDGDEAWFNVDASGFGVAPFGSRLFSGFATTGSMNNAKALAAFDGIVVNGTTFSPGGGAAPLQIGVDLLQNDRASFTLKEYPTLDGAVTSGACCFGLSCMQLTAADCAALSGQYRGDGSVCTPATCLPQNDLCENCSPVQTGVPAFGSNEGATGTDISSCAFNDTADVWHCWTASCTGTATFSLCGSSFDTTLSVFNTCTGGGQLGCNDDFAACGGDGLQSQLSLAVTAGNTYFIRVSGFNGLTGNYVLNVSCQTQTTGGNTNRPSGRVGGVSRQ